MVKNKKQIQQKSKKPSLKKDEAFGIAKWVPAAIIIFTALIYVRALFNDFVSLDDETYILKNPYIRDLSIGGIKAIFSDFYFGMYHPLTMLTYLFEYSCFGLNPLPYHLFNIILHLLNTWLVFRLTENLSGNKITAVVASLLFALHPMHVESVVWIAERKDLLYSFFYLFSLLIYLKYLKTGHSAKHYTVVLLLFTASLLSKPAAITLPLILFAVDRYKGRKFTTKTLLEKAPFLALSLFFGILALTQQDKNAFGFLSVSYNFFERILLVTYNIAFYIIKFVFPFQLSAIYYYPNPQGGVLPWQYYASLPFLAILGFIIYRISSFRREILFALAFFILSISVMLQLVPNGLAIVCDRYTYIPYTGFMLLAGQWISVKGIIWKKNTVIAIFSLVMVLFSYQTWDRIGVWKNGEILFTDIIKKSPDIFHCYWMRGNIRNNSGNLQGAIEDYNKTTEYDPSYNMGYIDRSAALIKLNDFRGALKDLNYAVSLDSTVPKQYNNRAAVFEQTGDIKAAMKDYNTAIRLDPELAEAYINRGMLRAKTGDTAGAMKDINMSVKLSPASAESYSTRGNIKAMKGDYKAAIDDFNYSLRLKPDDTVAYFNLGLLHLFIKDTAGCCQNLGKAKKLGGRNAAAAMMKYCR